MEDTHPDFHKRFHSKISYSRYRAEPGSTFASLAGQTDAYFESLRKSLISSFAELGKEHPQEIFLDFSVSDLVAGLKYYNSLPENFDFSRHYSTVETLIEQVRSFLETILHNIQTNMIVAQNLNTIDNLAVNLSTAELELKGQFERLDADLTVGDVDSKIRMALSTGNAYAGKLFKIINRVQQFELYFVLPEEELAQAIERIPSKADVNLGAITRRATELFDFFQSIRSMMASVDTDGLFQNDQDAVS
jgi:hypothetical protein